MSLIYKEYSLDPAAVDRISADVQAYADRLHMDSRSKQRVRLTAEELLLRIMERADRPIEVSVALGKQFGRHVFRLRYGGGPFDPTDSGDSPDSDEILRRLGYFPSWSCRGKENTVSFVLADRPKRSTVFYILLAMIAAAALGLAGQLLPEAVRRSAIDAILTPTVDGFLGLMNTFAGLLIFFTVCSGMTGMGGSASVGRAGRVFLLRLIGLSFAMSAVAAALVLPLLRLDFTADTQGQSAPFYRLSRMFFDFLPSDIVRPFQSGNALQIIVIAIIVGTGVIALGERGGRLRALTDESAALFQRVVSFICALVPLFVFAMLLRLIWSGEASMLLSIFKPLLLVVGSILVFSVVMWLLSSLRLRRSPLWLIKKTLQPFLVALTTASSMAALPLAMETCEQKLGVDKKTVSFIYPLGSVIYMPASVVYFTVLSLSCAEIYRIEVSLSWLVMAVIISTLTIIALPPVPGAGLLGFTVLFSSLGVPSEALVLVAAMDIVIDFVDTGFNVIQLLFQIACEAGRSRGPDRRSLRRQK